MRSARYAKQILVFKGYFEGKKMFKSLKALELARRFHGSDKRKDGVTPELAHQFEVVSFLIQMLDGRVPDEVLDEVIAAAILHDTPEDKGDEYSCSDLADDFGEMVFDITCGVTKPKGFKKKDPESYRLYFAGMLQNPFSPMVKGADRVNNIDTMIGVFTLGGRKWYVEEVETYFFPMLKAARRKYPEFFIIYLTIHQVLEKQIYIMKKLNEMEERFLEYKREHPETPAV